MQARLPLLVALLWLCAACEPDRTRGLTLSALAGEVPGPHVVFEPLERPQAEIPFPNDLLLTVDVDGKRHWNVSTQTTTANEKATREHLDDIEGFSGLTPISLAFDAPLDLTSVTAKTVYVINVSPQEPEHPERANPRFGERVPLDLGAGWFPHSADPHAYLPLDPLKDFDSYLLPPNNKVDTDGDGVPDKWVYHYEVASHTLDLRPLLPLQAGAQYAVVLTRGVKGWSKSGQYGPIRSPWEWVNHDSQTEALERALPSLLKAGVKRGDVAFAWTLTIGDLSRTFRTLRDGLYGKGPFAWLDKEFPAQIAEIDDLGITVDGDGTTEGKPFVAGDSVFALQGAFMKPIVGLVAQAAPDVGLGTVDHVSHLVFGSYETPNLRATPDNVWRLDVRAGKVSIDEKKFHERVPFMLTVPKTTANHKPPFPVAIHAHATGTSRIEALLLADRLAEAGIATFAIDAVGHGPILTDPLKLLRAKGFMGLLANVLPALLFPNDADKLFPDTMTDEQKVEKLLQNGFVQELMVKGRAVDDDGDCLVEGGEAYYAPDAFRLRDAMRQTTLDYIVGVRMLHALSKNVPAVAPSLNAHTATADQLKPHMLAGDFDLDGVLDVGGDVPYFMTGVSLGGIHTALTAPLEPFIVAAAPVVPGAGLADIFVRTRLHDKVTGLVHVVSGPMLVGCPDQGKKDGSGKNEPQIVHLSWNDDSDDCQKTTRMVWKDPKSGACLAEEVEASVVQADLKVPAGARVILRNLANGETAETLAAANGSFRLAVPSDVGDRFDVLVRGPGDVVTATAEVRTPYTGLARERNTPEFRHFVQLAANVLEGADAITVANRVLLDPLPGHPRTNMLMMLAVNDKTVPFTQGVALARATGLFGRGDPMGLDAAYLPWTVAAIASGLLTGKDMPPPVLDPSHPEGGDGLCNVIPTDPAQPDGAKSALCLANVHGHHEYIAQPRADGSFGAIPEDAKYPHDAPYKGTYTEYHRNLIVTYLHSLGKHVAQDPCWGDAKCIEDRGLHAEWSLPVGVVK